MNRAHRKHGTRHAADAATAVEHDSSGDVELSRSDPCLIAAAAADRKQVGSSSATTVGTW